MKPTYEDVYQTQHPSVDEYLRHVQQSTLLSAIQVSLASNTDAVHVHFMPDQLTLPNQRHSQVAQLALPCQLPYAPACPCQTCQGCPSCICDKTFLNGEQDKAGLPCIPPHNGSAAEETV